MLLAASAAYAGEAGTKGFSAEGVQSLVIETEAGDVAVSAGGTEIRGEVTKPDPKKCEVSMTSEGGVVTFRAAGVKTRWFGNKTCRAGFRVRAPASLAVTVRTVSGDSSVEGSQAGLRLTSVSGDVRLKAVGGELALKTTSGDIQGATGAKAVEAETISGNLSLDGLVGLAGATSVSGEIRLTWKAAPDSGEVRANTVSGNIELRFPESSRLKAKLDSISGDKANEFAESAQASLKIRAASISGDIRILKPKS